MTIMLLGGTGYLGKRLIKEFIMKAHTVIIVCHHALDITIAKETKHQVLMVKDEKEKLGEYIKAYKVDWILNLAGQYEKKQVTPGCLVEANLIYGLQYMTIGVENGVKNFLTINTALPEEFNLYSFSKRKLGDFGRFYSNKYGIHYWDILLEMFYGEDEPEDRFLPMCIRKMLRDEELFLTKGTQRRDIIYIDDVCNIIESILHKRQNGYVSLPVGTGEAPTIRDIVEFIHGLLNSDSKLRFGAIPMRENEPDCIADMGTLIKLGLHPVYSWREGLAKMCERKGMLK